MRESARQFIQLVPSDSNISLSHVSLSIWRCSCDHTSRQEHATSNDATTSVICHRIPCTSVERYSPSFEGHEETWCCHYVLTQQHKSLTLRTPSVRTFWGMSLTSIHLTNLDLKGSFKKWGRHEKLVECGCHQHIKSRCPLWCYTSTEIIWKLQAVCPCSALFRFFVHLGYNRFL